MAGLEDALARIPGLAGYLGTEQFTQRQNAGQLENLGRAQTLQEHFTKAAKERGLREALTNIKPDATDEEKLQAILPFVGADGAFKTIEGRRAREAALEQANVFRQIAEDRKAEELKLRKKEQARKDAVSAYRDLPPGSVPSGAPLAEGSSYNFGGGKTGPLETQPTDAQAIEMWKASGNVQNPSPAVAGPAQAIPPQEVAPEAPVASPSQPAATIPAQGAPVARGEVPPTQGAPVARGIPKPPPELEAEWAKLPRGGAKGSDRARTDWVASQMKASMGTGSEDAVTNDAWYTIINGKARPGSLPIGRDEGNRYREKLREKTAEIAKELGLSPQELASLGTENRAKAVALNAVQKDLAAIRPYDEMLNLNAKIALDLAKKISSSRTGSQFVNKPITWLQANAGDNPDIAEYLFQINTVRTEGARILNNPRLVGQLTDSARHEMGDVINGNMPLGQTERVLGRMIADGKNRVNSIEKEKDSLVNSIRGSANRELPKAADDVKAAVERAGYPYEPDTYEYRVGIGGQVQRRKK